MTTTAKYTGESLDGQPHGISSSALLLELLLLIFPSSFVLSFVVVLSPFCFILACDKGKGRVEFANRFFVFDGVHQHGVRRMGKLLLGDGGYYEGQFDAEGEITGSGFRSWRSGESYSGQFTLGERHGLVCSVPPKK